MKSEEGYQEKVIFLYFLLNNFDIYLDKYYV